MPALGGSLGRAAPRGSAPELQVTSVFKDNLADIFFSLQDLEVLKKRFHCESVTGWGVIVLAYYRLAGREFQAVKLGPFYF